MGNSRLYWLVLPGCDGAVSAPADNRNGAVLSGPGHRGDSRLVILIPMRLVHVVWRTLLGVVDRWSDPPIMQQRINAGSDKYFAWREKHEGDSEVDEFLDPSREYTDGA